MALINCPECGATISEYAEACTNCGCPKAKIVELLTRNDFTRPGVFRFFNSFFKEEIVSEKERYFLSSEYYPLIGDILDSLTPNERTVIELRYGLLKPALSLNDISKEFGVTEERISQIEAKALRKLHHPSRERILAAIWRYPEVNQLRNEATARGYEMAYDTAEDIQVPAGEDKGFATCCYKVLHMLPPETCMVEQELPKGLAALNLTIEEIDLSVRGYNCLKRANINTVADIVVMSEAELLKVRNLGMRGTEEIKEKIASMGLSLRGYIARAAEAKQDIVVPIIQSANNKSNVAKTAIEEPACVGVTCEEWDDDYMYEVREQMREQEEYYRDWAEYTRDD